MSGNTTLKGSDTSALKTPLRFYVLSTQYRFITHMGIFILLLTFAHAEHLEPQAVRLLFPPEILTDLGCGKRPFKWNAVLCGPCYVF